nr:unnamed protein product [Callosobruchus analis]
MSTREEIAMWTNLTEARVRVGPFLTIITHEEKYLLALASSLITHHLKTLNQ